MGKHSAPVANPPGHSRESGKLSFPHLVLRTMERAGRRPACRRSELSHTPQTEVSRFRGNDFVGRRVRAKQQHHSNIIKKGVMTMLRKSLAGFVAALMLSGAAHAT